MVIKKCCNPLFLFLIISLATSIIFMSSYELSFAQKNDNDKENDDNDDNDKLVVKTRIHLGNLDLENTKFFRVVGFINGQDVKQDVPISSINKTKNTLSVDLKVDKDTEIVEADTPDEFFVCAYQVGDTVKDYTSFTNFDCNESDLVNIDKPTVINLFRSGSAVYSTSKAVYDQSILNKNPNNANNNNPVKIKISAPLTDKKDTEKLVIAVMIKGQIQSEVIENVQDRLDKSDDNTISKTFTFDRKTDIGPIQIGDRYHDCVSSEDLRPPEGTECEKRILKNLDKVSGLYAR
ncbi:MAG TPA: hypothetical protein VFK40_08010 [Nitrososphaeraceae archaeon]|nr:hypothetical protein [Nitrososphaeraceae archaeon]